MPFIRITTSATLAPPARASLAADVTQAIATILGKRREVTAVLIESVDPAGWFIDAQTVDPTRLAPLQVDIFITAGTNSVAEKAAMLAAMHELAGRHLGALPEASYVIIHEIAGTDWGYAGVSQEARRLVRLGGTPAGA